MKCQNRVRAAWSIAFPMTAVAADGCAYAVTPVDTPESLGFASSRLARISAWQRGQVDAGALSGAVAAVARNGKLAYLHADGFRDQAKTSPMRSSGSPR